MYEKSIVLVNFIFRVDGYDVEGNAALFFTKGDYIPMTDEEILGEIKKQYGYDAVQILHRQKEKA
ncbi:hypothetical protein [Lysinibacillus odysseyi]|uniref:Uncharacterized protein n=1 Tax=Lysinibacillus odysseyi 34hs-1 = NBRC 100172 TaxID=1220589 RepID=A0A0A3JQ53_9BACI|nr:hypothetical protein [Lysinibacillus odysseyi]KGR89162.1 hypothetical protein CD32_00660 [Lysinibacillus odysseyi 34hs-1 = NBRC 100172]